MRVFRGESDGLDAEDVVVQRMIDRAATDLGPTLRVWRPARHCSFGPRDVTADGYHRAREAAIERGFPPVERRTGGTAVAYTGSTVAVALAMPTADTDYELDTRYDEIATAIQRALWRLGVPAQRGEPADSFCPGSRALQWNGKLAGFAQRVTRGVALVGAVVVVRDHRSIGNVLDAVYDALGVPFDPEAVGSVERAGGSAEPDRVVRTFEEVLVEDADVTVEWVDQEG